MKITAIGMMMLMLAAVTALAEDQVNNSVQLCYGDGEHLDRCGTIIQYNSRSNSCWIRQNTVAGPDDIIYREDLLQVISMGIDYCTKMR